ncbi:MAG: DUF2267 domain-containing protein [Spirochaetia bacterium]
MLNFEKYTTEANVFVKHLAKELGHENDIAQTGKIIRAVLHTLRDRISMSENLDFLAQLPMYIKALYVDDWKYKDKPDRLKSVEDFAEKVKEHQRKYGETDFDWPESTEEIIKGTMGFIKNNYVSRGELEHVKSNMPEDLRVLV